MLEKFFVDGVKRLRCTFLADFEKLGNIIHFIQPPFLGHLEIDMPIAIAQKEFQRQVNTL